MTNPSKIITPAVPFERSEVEGSIDRRFQRVVRAVPDRVAVDVLTDRLTYAQLDVSSDHIARAIISRLDLPRDTPVALLIEEKHFAMAAIFGILKAGKAVVVFPTDLPLERLRYLWNDSLNPLVLTTRQSMELTRQVVSTETDCFIIDDLVSGENGSVGGMPLPKPQPGDLALISYTSGSSGNPKGVMQPHRMILHSAYLHQTRFQLSPQDRNAIMPTFGYGAAKTNLFAALLNGVTAYIPNLKQMKISTLLEWLQQEQITILGSPPIGFLRQIMDGMTDGIHLPHVRLVTMGGEDFYPRDVDRFWKCFEPETMLAFRLTGNEIELTRELHLHPGMKFSTEKIPVGYPVPDKEVLLLDEQGKEVPPGGIGEIIVRSRYLATGYWRQPELTAERFKPDPVGGGMRVCHTGDLGRINALGQMEHMGRKDNMFKIHGFSVHLESVDQALGKLPYIKEGASAAFPLPGGDRRLVAYLVPAGGEKPPVGEIRRGLTQLLPEHMQPSAFVWLDELPRLSTGKVDRKSLPPAPRERPDLGEKYLAPRDELEGKLVEAWQRLLQLDEIGVEDNFFDLGGDSLSSVQMVIEAEREMGITIPKSYFQKPTIANLAVLHREGKKSEGEKSTPNLERNTLVVPGSKGRHVTKYRAAVRKVLRRQWTPGEIIHRLMWFGTSIRLGFNDLLIKKPILRHPYWEGMKELSRWVKAPIVAKVLYREQYRLFSRLLSELDGCTIDPDIGFQTSMMGNMFSRLGLQAKLEQANNYIPHVLLLVKDPFFISLLRFLEETPPDRLHEIFPVYHLEYLEEAYRVGKGVILLTYHGTVNRLAVAALSHRFKGETIPAISEKRARLESGHWQDNYARDLPARELAALKAGVALEGQHLLSEGKIVQFVSDNEYTLRGHAVIIAGRRYYLRPGFAELALNTGAAVVPQYNYMGSDGRIHMTILPPLRVGDGDREAQTAHLLDQYAAFINSSWSAAPGSIRWPRVFRHFDQPLSS